MGWGLGRLRRVPGCPRGAPGSPWEVAGASLGVPGVSLGDPWRALGGPKSPGDRERNSLRRWRFCLWDPWRVPRSSGASGGCLRGPRESHGFLRDLWGIPGRAQGPRWCRFLSLRWDFVFRPKTCSNVTNRKHKIVETSYKSVLWIPQLNLFASTTRS